MLIAAVLSVARSRSSWRLGLFVAAAGTWGTGTGTYAVYVDVGGRATILGLCGGELAVVWSCSNLAPGVGGARDPLSIYWSSGGQNLLSTRPKQLSSTIDDDRHGTKKKKEQTISPSVASAYASSSRLCLMLVNVILDELLEVLLQLLRRESHVRALFC